MRTTAAPPARAGGLDLPLVVKGASRAFAVLLLGGLAQPLASLVWPPLGYVWLLVVAVTAFVGGAVVATPTPDVGWRTAPWAAVGGYLLVLPLVISAAAFDPVQAVLTSVTAVVVGTVVGLVRTSA